MTREKLPRLCVSLHNESELSTSVSLKKNVKITKALCVVKTEFISQ